MSRKDSEKQARRTYVLAAARAVFADKGIENTRMEDIAAAAEYTRRTLYSYFKSRDEIGLLVHVEDQRLRWEQQRAALSAARDGLDALRIWVETLFAFSRENPSSMQLQLYWDFKGIERSTLAEESFAAYDALNSELAEALRALFRRGVEDGSLRPDLDVDTCISQFLYSSRAVISRALSTGHSFAPIDADSYVAHFIELFSRSVAHHDGGPR